MGYGCLVRIDFKPSFTHRAFRYYSPYPSKIIKPDTETIFVCEYCLNYYTDIQPYKEHVQSVCQWKKPPGNEIYRHENLSVFEVFGCIYKVYCQSLCLLSKLFLDHKTLYYEVENFRFYVLWVLFVFLARTSFLGVRSTTRERILLAIFQRNMELITTWHALWFFLHFNEEDTESFLFN